MMLNEESPQVVVWEADGSPYGCLGYGHPIASRLAAAGVDVATVPLTRRQPSPIELAAPIHLLSGGSTPVNAQPEWLRAARLSLGVVLARALAGEATVTGICFGAQLIATLLAGPDAVGPNPRGLEAGLALIQEIDGSSDTVVAEFHYDQIHPYSVEAIGGTIVLTNDHTPVQAFSIGSSIVGLQFHPELDPPATWATICAHREFLQAHASSPATVLASIRRLASRWTPEPFDRFITGPALSPASTLGSAADHCHQVSRRAGWERS